MDLQKYSMVFQDEDKECFVLGHFMDALFDNTINDFLVTRPYQKPAIDPNYVNIYTSKGEFAKNFQTALEAFEFAKTDEVFFDYCANGKQQVIYTGEIVGVPFKIMIDNLRPEEIIRKY